MCQTKKREREKERLHVAHPPIGKLPPTIFASGGKKLFFGCRDQRYSAIVLIEKSDFSPCRARHIAIMIIARISQTKYFFWGSFT